MEFKIDGLDEFITLLENAEDNVKKEAKRTINRVCNKTKAKVMLKTPVAKKDGGTLRRSWHFKTKNEFEGVIYNNTEYALHVEYGHRTRLGTGGNSENPKYKYKPKTNGIKFVEGRYMLTESLEEVKDEIEDELITMFKNLFKE